MEIGRRYWLSHLTGEIPRSALPVQYPKTTAFEQASYPIELSTPLAAQLSEVSKNKKISIFVTLFSAFQAWLGKVNGGLSEIALTIPVLPLSSDDSPGTHLIIRNQIRSEATFKETLERVKQSVAEGYKHQYVDLQEIAGQLGLQKEEALSTPLAFAMSGLHREADIQSLCNGKYEAVIVVDQQSDGITINFHYNGRLFASEAIEIYARSFIFALEQYLHFPENRISQAVLLEQEEGKALIEAFNDTDVAYASEMTIPQLIERQVLLTPDGVAVCSEGGLEVTYRELNERANQLAALLVEQGIQAGSYVAVLLDRSVEMIVGVLGILKAGAAYVPIEPGYPKSRIETILGSLPIKTIVTKQDVMRSFQELIWTIESLQDVVYLDVNAAMPPAEQENLRMMGALWDQVAEESKDYITAGGFISSYSGLPFTEAEVDEYRNRVVGQARPFVTPQSSVLEVGCGSGLIAFSIAPMVQRFVGLDPSRRMLEMNSAKSAELGLSHMEWIEGYALQIEGMESGSFDLVLMASTAQFFPGYFYFEQVVREAMRCLKPGGTLIVADIMDLRRKESFLESVRQYRVEHGMSFNDRGANNHELYFDEDFFTDLQLRIPEIDHTEVLHRREGFANELGYRFDLVFRKKIGSPKEKEGTSFAEDVYPMTRCRKRSWTRFHLDRYPTSNPATGLTLQHEAYVIFTSGTTGTPKGVVVRHRPVINLIEWVNRTFGVGSEDRLLFVTSLCFDLSVYDIFGMLASGGSIRIASEGELSDRERLLEILRTEPITFWDSAPAALQQLALLMEIDAEAAAASNPNLRLAFLSGDWIPLTLPDVMKKHFPNVQVVALGGATEATVWSNYYPVTEVEEHWVSIPYGTPIQNAKYYILDSKLQPCPPYIPGDLYIGGECLASGYTDPRLTEERFLPDPFRERKIAGAQMYKTGDLARWMPNGVMEFLGRSDHQVKIRGYRIELGDIQAQLLKHPCVLEALVTDWTDASGSKSLCAYYTLSGEQFSGELKEYLSGLLPDYMIPSYFVSLPVMPITANGKIDRGALPGPQDHLYTNVSYEEPVNSHEKMLAQIWEEVLGVERIGVTDDFYTLGGDSLKAVQVVAKANEYAFAISLRDMLSYRTVREIVEAGEWRTVDEAAVGISNTEDSDARKYNLAFGANIQEIPYYYPCMMGAMYTKIQYEAGYPIPRGFLPVCIGLGISVFSVPLSGVMEDRLQIDDIRDIPGLDLLGRLGIDVKPKQFNSIAEGMAWCEEKMSLGQLVIGVGTTYFLNYSHDYLMDEDQFATKILEIEQGISKNDVDGIHHSHMFLLVDHTQNGYTVYDSTYNFYGTIPEEELKRSFAGAGSLEFLKRYPVRYANAQRIVLDVSFENFQEVPFKQLAIEILEKHIDYYCSPEPFELVTEKRLIYTGLSSFKPFLKLIEDASLDEELHEKLYLFVMFWVRKWKYTFIFFRDFLQDAQPLLEIQSLEELIEVMKDSINCLGNLFDQLQDGVDRRNEIQLAELQRNIELVWAEMNGLETKQRKAFAGVQDELDLIREWSK